MGPGALAGDGQEEDAPDDADEGGALLQLMHTLSLEPADDWSLLPPEEPGALLSADAL